MSCIAVVGMQWGDEGKGKIVDWLGEWFDVIVRFQGGNNAGHTICSGKKTYKLSVIPSGVVRSNMKCMIASGVVLDPWVLLEEIEALTSEGVRITPENFVIAENIPLILPFHRELDNLREKLQSGIGTTLRGIGPCYEDRAGRRSVRVSDLRNESDLRFHLKRALEHHDIMREYYQCDPIDLDALVKELMDIAPKILPYVDRVWSCMNEEQAKGKRVLFEGAQGVLLDVEYGTHPCVTSSSTLPFHVHVPVSKDIPSYPCVLGVMKAYTTRVGDGVFPTELSDDAGSMLMGRGHEFGTVTGRGRRCGWFDAVLAKQAITVSRASGIILTKVDVLDEFDEIKVCVAYKLDGRQIVYFPASIEAQTRIEPVYVTLSGWKTSVCSMRNWDALPEELGSYVKYLESLLGINILAVSVGPEREAMVVQDKYRELNYQVFGQQNIS